MAVAAAALADVLDLGHARMEPADLVIAAHARDQVLACLTIGHRYLFAGLGHTATPAPQDLLRHPVLGLGEVLNNRPGTGLDGPAPTDVAVNLPTHPTARAWTVLARELDAAVVEIARARPDRPAWAWALTGVAPRDPDAPPPPGSPQTAWALAADLAAFASALAAADTDLGVALHGAGEPFRGAARAVTDPTLADLRAVALLALRMAESGPLPGDYHLPENTVGTRPLVPSSPVDVAVAIQRAGDLVADGPALTASQQRAFATTAARTAVLLARHAPASITAPLQTLAEVAARYATFWATSRLFPLNAGHQAAIEQLRAAAAFLAPRANQQPLPAPAAARAAARLPVALAAAAANARTALSEDAFLAVDPHAPGATAAPISRHPERRRHRTAADRLDTAARDAHHQLAPHDPGRPPRPARSAARELLQNALTSPATSRPAHPALPPQPARPAPSRTPRR